jgi:hypothetical protein
VVTFSSPWFQCGEFGVASAPAEQVACQPELSVPLDSNLRGQERGIDSTWDSLRTDSNFIKLLERLGLPQA